MNREETAQKQFWKFYCAFNVSDAAIYQYRKSFYSFLYHKNKIWFLYGYEKDLNYFLILKQSNKFPTNDIFYMILFALIFISYWLYRNQLLFFQTVQIDGYEHPPYLAYVDLLSLQAYQHACRWKYIVRDRIKKILLC